MSAIQLRGVSEAFGPTAVLHGIDLDIADGKIVGPPGLEKPEAAADGIRVVPAARVMD